MDKLECPTCGRKSLKRGLIEIRNDCEYFLPMKCRSKKCGYEWEIPVATWILRSDQKVGFKPPAKKKGILVDRAVIASVNVTENPYWDVVDLIQFEEEEPEWIRISYYLRDRRGSLTWGGQTSISEPISIWKKMLLQTARDKVWFRELLENVINELEKERPASGSRRA